MFQTHGKAQQHSDAEYSRVARVVAFAAVLIVAILVAWAVPMGDFARSARSRLWRLSHPRRDSSRPSRTPAAIAASTIYRLMVSMSSSDGCSPGSVSTTGPFSTTPPPPGVCIQTSIVRWWDGFDVAALDLDSPSD